MEIVATFGPAMSKVMRFRKTHVVLFSDRIKGTASTLACIVLDRSLQAIECGAGLYTLAFSETVEFSVVYTGTIDLLFSLF